MTKQIKILKTSVVLLFLEDRRRHLLVRGRQAREYRLQRIQVRESTILSESRKYALNLTLTNQFLDQTPIPGNVQKTPL